MGASSWAIPVGVLTGIAVLCFIFIWWWFPQAWRRGVNQDLERMAEQDEPARVAQHQANRDIIENYKRKLAIQRGEIVEPVEDKLPGYAVAGAPPPPIEQR